MLNILRLLRPHQWIKSSFVFAGIIFAHLWGNHFLVKQTILIGIAFSFLASAMYIINDFTDREIDALHPLKKNRPLAAGTISNQSALILATLLGLTAFSIGFATTPLVLTILVAYVALNFAYSYCLKNIIYLDVLAIASGFLLRILAGTSGIGIPPSVWILICGFTLTLFLALLKRRAELPISGNSKFGALSPYEAQRNTGNFFNNAISRGTLTSYSSKLLNSLITLTLLCTLISYSCYSIQHQFIYTIPVVVLGMMRYLYICYQMPAETPTQHGIDLAKDLLGDWVLLAIILIWVLMVLI